MGLITILERLEEVLNDIRHLPPSREIAIAITKMEEVIHRVKDRILVESKELILKRALEGLDATLNR